MNCLRLSTTWLVMCLSGFWATGAPTNFSSLVYPGQTGQLIYQPDAQGDRIPDFSRVGYRFGEMPLPDVEFAVESNRWVYVAPVSGAADTVIQNAINQVSTLTTNAHGFRGVVQLRAGEFIITNKLFIRTNGVVLRGMGDGTDTNSNTILRSTTTNQVSLIDVDATGGSRTTVPSTTHNITDKVVPVGATSFRVDSTNNWQVGHRVIVQRPSTTNWISDIGMNRIPQNSTTSVVQWAAGSYDQLYERIITRLEGNRVFLDAPLPNSLEQKYGGGTVYRFTFSQRLTQVGVENLRGESAFASATDEKHAWSFIELDRVEDCWVRNITAKYFGFSAVVLSTLATRVTVIDGQCLDPKSVIDGGRRYAFNNQGQLNLMRDMFSEKGRHDFVNNSPSRGPNVFYSGVASNQYSEAGPHQRWSAGTLYDNLRCYGDALAAYNRGNYGTGHGWSGAQMIYWNCRADTFSVENPITAQNWVIGGVGAISNPSDFLNTPVGTYDRHGTNVTLGDPLNNPDNSLYLAQLHERLADRTVQIREYVLGDFDQCVYDGTNSADKATVDAAWNTAIQSIVGTLGTMDFDQITNNVFEPFTFNYQLDAGDQVVGAVLTLGLRRTGGATTNDSLWLEHPTNELTFINLGLTNTLPTNSTSALIYEFPAATLANLQDGQLNGLVGEDVAVDWAILQLKVAAIGEPAVTVLEPVADAFVRNGTSATTNFGTATVLTVKASSPEVERQSLLRFNLVGVAGKVVDVKVRLLCSSVSDPVIHAAAFVADDTWSETGVTWSNAPAAGSLFAEWAPQAGQFVELPVTSFVQDALAGDGAVSFLIYSTTITSNGFVNYYSREAEAANRPQLVVTISNTPPTLSVITNRTIGEDTAAGPIALVVGDLESGPAALTLDVVSSNPVLVPPTNVTFGGSGSNRTLTVLPATNQTGVATLSVTVTDPQGRTNGRAFILTVTNINDAPMLAAITNRILNAGQTLAITNIADDVDTPPQTFAFSLLSYPTGAVIGATSGIITWRPLVAQASSTNLFRVRVADNGSPSLSATQQFSVIVTPFVPSQATQTTLINRQFRLTVVGELGPDYVVQVSTNLTTWNNIFTTNSPTPPFDWTDTNTSGFLKRFYRVQTP